MHLVENFDFDDARESLEALLQKFIGSFIKHTASLLKFLTDLFVNTLKKIKTTPFKDSDNIYYSASRIIGILKILFVSK